jgi:hypothetical protein
MVKFIHASSIYDSKIKQMVFIRKTRQLNYRSGQHEITYRDKLQRR